MKNHFIILLFILPLFSCKSQLTGIYIGNLDSEVKSIKSSKLELLDNKEFVLSTQTTSLEFDAPYSRILELHGQFEYKNQTIILTPRSKRTDRVKYEENSKSTNTGVRNPKFVLKDTLIGNLQIIEKVESIKYNFSKKSNSTYIWNDENCFVKYIKTDTSHDLINYCDEIRNQK